jgi:acetyl-CoA carboxylase carboxyl transferase subunit beta
MADTRIDVSIEQKGISTSTDEARNHPNTCPACGSHYRDDELDSHLGVCPQCGHHFPVGARERIEQLADQGSFFEEDADLRSTDPLGFFDLRPYRERLAEAELKTGEGDAIVIGRAEIEDLPCQLSVMDFGFMGGSMGAVVGEKVTRAAEDALAERIPLIIVSASGGARMQEGTLALMQLAKTCAILERVRAGGIPFISVMSDPTTGGVFASYAVLGDVNLAEPNALIGFAGARVSAGTIAQELPPGFQRSEFLFEHGFIDRIVNRRALRGEVASLLRFMRAPELPADQRSAFSPIGAFLSSVVGVASGAAGAVGGAAAGAVGGAIAIPATSTGDGDHDG